MTSKSQKGNVTTQIKTGSAKKKVKNKQPIVKEDSLNKASSTESKLYPEVKILISLALAIFLMLCNFHLCSILGDFFYDVMHGLFGFSAYIFPIVLFFGYSFLLSNAGRKDAKRKVLLGAFIFWDLTSIAELIGLSEKTVYNPILFFKNGLSGFNGGLSGGMVGGGLSLLVGKIAAFLFLIVILIILGILITERNLSTFAVTAFHNFKTRTAEQRQLRIEKRKEENWDSDFIEDDEFDLDDIDDTSESDLSKNPDAASAYREDSYKISPVGEQVGSDSDFLPYEDVTDSSVEPSQNEPEEKKFFSVSLGKDIIPVNKGEIASGLNAFINARIPFLKDKAPKREKSAVVYEEKERDSVINRSSNVPRGNASVKGTSSVRGGRIYFPKEKISLEELGFSEFLTEETPTDELRKTETINDFILYNSIKEWSEDEPFVMPAVQVQDEKTAPRKGPQMVLKPSAEVVSPDTWQNEHKDKSQSVYELNPHNKDPEITLVREQPKDSAGDPGLSSFERDEEEFYEYDEEGTDSVDQDYEFEFPIEENNTDHPISSTEEAVDLTEHVKLPENDFSDTELSLPGKKKKDTDSIWRTKDDFSNRSDSGAVTFGSHKKPAVKKKVKKAYVKAPLDLLSSGGEFKLGIDRHQIEVQKKLYNTLESFGVHVKMGAISVGPAVTRYELEPEVGVKVSRIVGLQDDIKLALAAADVRIEAPIPGKSAVGIEVPNAKSTTVGFRELIDTEKFRTHPSKLCVAIGRDLAGQIQLADLAKMPHLLIAGATGSGKSVCINTLIMSILYKATPDEVKLIMVDPKVVELSAYNGIPHLLIPVVTDPRKASNALRWAVDEMDDRYTRLAEYKVRNIQGYNEEIKKRKKEDPSFEGELMYQMVIIVDELADLMMVAPGEVEESICRLAQKARAAGIHLVLATQRPSVNVITGLIKANVPSRIAFAVSSGVDSRTILDMNGAEKLLGRGDMLYYPYGLQKPIRVQGAFISDEDVSKVVDYIVAHNMETKSGAEQMEEMITSVSLPEEPKNVTDGRDEHFEEAARFIIESDKASIGSLQRKFRIGFNRAARLMDALADEGIVGEEEGTKPRKILMNMEELENYLSTHS